MQDQQVFITWDLNAKLSPEYRYDIEDDIMEYMESHDIPCDIDGGGTYQNDDGSIASCDIHFVCELQNLEQVLEYLKSLPCPKGSKLSYCINPEDENAEPVEIPVGNLEGLSFRVNGQDLPDEVYQNNDINVVVDAMLEVLQDQFVMRGVEQLEHSYLYFYGKSYQQMYDLVKDFDQKFELCQQCRIEQIA